MSTFNRSWKNSRTPEGGRGKVSSTEKKICRYGCQSWGKVLYVIVEGITWKILIDRVSSDVPKLPISVKLTDVIYNIIYYILACVVTESNGCFNKD